MSVEILSTAASCMKNHIRKGLQYVNKHIINNTCYNYSRGVGVRKVSNSKRDLQGHLRTLVLLPFDKPHVIS